MTAIADAWARAMDRAGTTAILRRRTTGPSDTDDTVRVKEITSPIASSQQDIGFRARHQTKRFLILVADISNVTLPLRPRS